MVRGIASIVAVAGLAAAASAQSAVYTAATSSSGPRYNRLVADGVTGLSTGLSTVGTNTPYHVQPFWVGTSGPYNFFSNAGSPNGWDQYLWLYGSSWNPANPAIGAIRGNDDFNNLIGQSGFSGVSLTANTQYYLITTGYENSDFGSFTNSITWASESEGGPINLGMIPSPGAAALFGLGGLMATKRRRTR
jgi:hypothetical protein